MILRGLLSGNIVLFEEVMAELSDMPIDKVASYIHDRHISGFRALYHKAGLPAAAYAAFREAIAGMRDGLLNGEQGGAAQLKRRLVEYVLERCAHGGGTTALMALLRRFTVEAAREEARMFCDDLVANNDMVPVPLETDTPAPVRSEAVSSAPMLPELESAEPKRPGTDPSELEFEPVPAGPELLEQESSEFRAVQTGILRPGGGRAGVFQSGPSGTCVLRFGVARAGARRNRRHPVGGVRLPGRVLSG